jgi:uncharacterized protein (DUF58 family)
MNYDLGLYDQMIIELTMLNFRSGPGHHESSRPGSGYTPLGIAEWEPGDPLAGIHWSLTSESGVLTVVRRSNEIFARTTVVVDLSEGVNWAGAEAFCTGHVLAGTLAMTLAHILAGSNDRVGHLVAGSNTHFGEPEVGSDAIYSLRRSLDAAKPAADGEFAERLERFAAQSRTGEPLFVISNFLAETDKTVGRGDKPGSLARMAATRDVVALQLRDPWHTDISKLGTFKVPNGSRTSTVYGNRKKVQTRFTDAANNLQSDLETRMRAAGIRHQTVYSNKPLAPQIRLGISRLNERMVA